ncbi:hypothetical protein [Roseiterribacter gracilis]|uniref:Uncharacterized protein n=1 Tax=Roseiterribacter gracilis TaxID=2812848 RepID=A0A8S8X8K9_9PROT|nr:hypothetical protein TMPK1_05490 [Rhodospirillales bacterium TMPK1]
MKYPIGPVQLEPDTGACMTAPKVNDDPTLAMCRLWTRDRDHYDDMLHLTSLRERAVFHAPGDDEAERLFRAQATVTDRLGDKLERFTRAIFRTRAQSLEGAVAKLAVVLRHVAPSNDTNEEPWPYLRNVHADLERLHQAAANSNESAEHQTG